MTREEIDKIASDYLNDCESESDMLEVFAVAKAATYVIDGHIDELVDKFMESLFDATLDKIRFEIVNLPDINPDYPMDKRVHICKGEALYIIDKYRKGDNE